MYFMLIGPIIILAKIIITYFAFYLYAQTHLKGSLLTAIGMLTLVLSHVGSQYFFRMLPDFGLPLGDIRLISTTLNIAGYLLFTLGFTTLAIDLTQRFKKTQ